ncbi:hypothetical protein MAE02_26580 [Microvirga aerophila]|uniref:Uncharacterized protein n=1 Tax=Microvirga aerophila TaxID=670291 RepID=A0A512BSR4_9HYPH|nr:hypothetical protein MAE02_26580 [Microvirga aerophila]
MALVAASHARWLSRAKDVHGLNAPVVDGAESRTATPPVGDLQHDRHRIRSSKPSDVSSPQVGNQRVRH